MPSHIPAHKSNIGKGGVGAGGNVDGTAAFQGVDARAGGKIGGIVTRGGEIRPCQRADEVQVFRDIADLERATALHRARTLATGDENFGQVVRFGVINRLLQYAKILGGEGATADDAYRATARFVCADVEACVHRPLLAIKVVGNG